MKVLAVCDKFKGSLSSVQVNHFLEKGILLKNGKSEILSIPMADGGEGTSEVLLASVKVQKRYVDTIDPLGRKITAWYLVGEKGEVYIESAMICGLSLLKAGEKDPKLTHSGGLGIVLRNAVQGGAKTIHLFLGGSATNDGGAGMAKELEVIFYDKNGAEIYPAGGNLKEVERIKKPENRDYHIHVWTDTNIVLTGDSGASHMYAQQKGAKEGDVEDLEKGMVHFTKVVERDLHKKGEHLIPGAGAAGGLAYGCMVFFDASVDLASPFLFRLAGVEKALEECDVVITGEGSLDRQSLTGKLVSQIAVGAKKYHKKCIAVCGQNKLSENEWSDLGISEVFAIISIQPDVNRAVSGAEEYLVQIGQEIAERYTKNPKV